LQTLAEENSLWKDFVPNDQHHAWDIASVLPVLDQATQAVVSIALINCLDKGEQAGMFCY